MVPVAPRKRLHPNAEVGVGVELWFPVLLDVVVVLLLFLPSVVGGEDTERNGPKQRDVPPSVGEANGVVLLRLYTLDVCARRASPCSLSTPHTNSSKRRHFLYLGIGSKCGRSSVETRSIVYGRMRTPPLRMRVSLRENLKNLESNTHSSSVTRVFCLAHSSA